IYYLNNILIYSKVLVEYKGYIKKILNVLYKYKFSINIEKNEFYIKEIIFLKYLILKNEVKIELNKVKAIRN
ncbi:hypothetical protein NEUTE2DRAFT_60805, partial [Neurospora tetrasperma FGSC 2509]